MTRALCWALGVFLAAGLLSLAGATYLVLVAMEPVKDRFAKREDE